MDKYLYHILAIIIVVIWGTTFVSTKVLLAYGLSPAAIFTLRFSLAYTVLLAFTLTKKQDTSTRKPEETKQAKNPSRRFPQIFCNSLKDELTMLSLGITSGSLYFLAENMALEHTTATNTSLIVCSCPLFTTLIFCPIFRQKLKKQQILGAFIAFIGMAVVVLNGQFVLHLSPVGDLLAFTACLCWAAYSVLMRLTATTYSSSFINRKIFFYGLLTIAPWFIAFPEQIPNTSQLLQPIVLGNVLFLGLIASLLCYCLWTVCIKRLGVIEATNYVYLNPIATMVAAATILSEHITVWFIAGSAMILLGLYLHNKVKS